MKNKWKWIIIGLVVLVALWAAFANLDARGVDRTCVTATPTDADGRGFSYTDPDGKSQTWEFSAEGKLIGLKPGEKIGFSYQKGRLSGMLYNEAFHMLDKDQSGRVTEFSIQRSGTGTNQRAAPRQRALPLGCPR